MFSGFDAVSSIRGHVAYIFVSASAPLPEKPVYGLHFRAGTAKLPRHSFYDVPTVPIWVISLICLVLPTARVVTRVRRMMLPGLGECVICRYKLTGNTSGVCPECGTPIQADNRLTTYHHNS